MHAHGPMAKKGLFRGTRHWEKISPSSVVVSSTRRRKVSHLNRVFLLKSLSIVFAHLGSGVYLYKGSFGLLQVGIPPETIKTFMSKVTLG